MSYVQQLLLKEKVKLEKQLFSLRTLHETPWLVMAFKAIHKSNQALQRYIESKETDKKAYWWATQWNEFKKHCIKQGNKQDFMEYPTRSVKLELAISEINGQLWRYNIKENR